MEHLKIEIQREDFVSTKVIVTLGKECFDYIFDELDKDDYIIKEIKDDLNYNGYDYDSDVEIIINE